MGAAIYAFKATVRQTTEVRMARQSSPHRPWGANCRACSPDSWPNWKRGCPVTVAELQQLLSDLGKFLRASQSASVAGELEYLCGKLQHFGGTS